MRENETAGRCQLPAAVGVVPPKAMPHPNGDEGMIHWTDEHVKGSCTPTGDSQSPDRPDGFAGHPCHAEHTEEASRVTPALKRTVCDSWAGVRHGVFTFGRELQAIPGQAQASLEDLRPLVARWHQAAQKAATKAQSDLWGFEDTWVLFVEGWGRIKHPVGDGIMDRLWREADRPDVPDLAPPEFSHDYRRLAKFCWVLQREASQPSEWGPVFFLSCREAARLAGLGEDFKKAARWLRALTLDGVLELRKQGTRGKASVYQCPSALPTALPPAEPNPTA